MTTFVVAVFVWNAAIIVFRVCALYAERLPSQRAIHTEKFVVATFLHIAFCGWAAWLVVNA